MERPLMQLESFREYRRSMSKQLQWLIELSMQKPISSLTIDEIKKAEQKINTYYNMQHLEAPSDTDIQILDDNLINVTSAEKEALEGKIFWEHHAAGEATRLGLGTKFLLRLETFTPKDVLNRIRIESKDYSGGKKNALAVSCRCTPTSKSRWIRSRQAILVRQ